jgi:hypothetical protein
MGPLPEWLCSKSRQVPVLLLALVLLLVVLLVREHCIWGVLAVCTYVDVWHVTKSSLASGESHTEFLGRKE